MDTDTYLGYNGYIVRIRKEIPPEEINLFFDDLDKATVSVDLIEQALSLNKERFEIKIYKFQNELAADPIKIKPR